jgi:hypothetical protein
VLLAHPVASHPGASLIRSAARSWSARLSTAPPGARQPGRRSSRADDLAQSAAHTRAADRRDPAGSTRNERGSGARADHELLKVVGPAPSREAVGRVPTPLKAGSSA